MEIVIEETPNGRQILQDADSGKYLVQPYNAEYWIELDTLKDARDAYHHPYKYRSRRRSE